VIEGTVEDEEGLKKIASSGATVFVSFAGPTYGSKGTVSQSHSGIIKNVLYERERVESYITDNSKI